MPHTNIYIFISLGSCGKPSALPKEQRDKSQECSWICVYVYVNAYLHMYASYIVYVYKYMTCQESKETSQKSVFSYGNMYMYLYMYMNIYMHYVYIIYGVATVSRLL